MEKTFNFKTRISFKVFINGIKLHTSFISIINNTNVKASGNKENKT